MSATENSTIKSIGLKESQKTLEDVTLYQNVPNPFHQTTTIHAVVPEKIQEAKIYIYTLQGKKLTSYDLRERGKTLVEISGGRFPSGTYIYALVADGRVITTKKMILTR